MGTRFCATQEAPLHPNIKQALVGAGERDTRPIFRTLRNTGRVLNNAVAEEVIATERRPGGCRYGDIRHLVAGSRGRDALVSGNVDGGLVWASQVVGLIHDIPTCAELIERVVADAHARLGARLAAFV